MFEFTEVEKIEDSDLVKQIVEYYRKFGFTTAIDDFGTGYSGLGLLADFQTNIIKSDMALIRNIERDSARQFIIKKMSEFISRSESHALGRGRRNARRNALATRCRDRTDAGLFVC